MDNNKNSGNLIPKQETSNTNSVTINSRLVLQMGTYQSKKNVIHSQPEALSPSVPLPLVEAGLLFIVIDVRLAFCRGKSTPHTVMAVRHLLKRYLIIQTFLLHWTLLTNFASLNPHQPTVHIFLCWIGEKNVCVHTTTRCPLLPFLAQRFFLLTFFSFAPCSAL
jgi:hypothetical protein